MRITESKLRSIIRSVIRENSPWTPAEQDAIAQGRYNPDGSPMVDQLDDEHDDEYDGPWTPGQRRAIEQGLYNPDGSPMDLD